MHRNRTMALCSALMLGTGASVLSASAMLPAPVESAGILANEQMVSGTIRTVDTQARSFVLATAGNESVTIKVDNKTSYTLNGESSTMGDALKAGYRATVTHKDKVASKVEASSS